MKVGNNIGDHMTPRINEIRAYIPLTPALKP